MNLQRRQPSQYASLDAWHRARLKVDHFGTARVPIRLPVDVYEALNPACRIVAVDDSAAIQAAIGEVSALPMANGFPGATPL